MSSTTTTSGRSAASRSSSRRTAQAVSSSGAGSSETPIAPRIARIACSSPSSSASIAGAGLRRARARCRPGPGTSCPRHTPGTGRPAASSRRPSPRTRRPTGLADSRRAHDRHEAACSLGARIGERCLEPGELRRAADEWRRRHPQWHRRMQVDQLAARRLDGASAATPADRLAEHDRAGRGTLGDPSRCRDRRAGDRVPAARTRAA